MHQTSNLKVVGSSPTILTILGVAQWLECSLWKREVAGSSPVTQTNLRACSSVVELSAHNRQVAGSIPATPTTTKGELVMDKAFNVNSYVKVKLTEIGKQELIRQNRELEEQIYQSSGKRLTFNLPKTGEDGYHIFQLWDLMRRFGHLMMIGMETPFETDIMLVENKEKTSKHISDPLEQLVADALDSLGIKYEHESEPTTLAKVHSLDFYIPGFDIFIEIKRFHTERVTYQISRVENLILLQGEQAVKTFVRWILTRREN